MPEFIAFEYPFTGDERLEKIWNQISSMRHDVYAAELQQYEENPQGELQDPGKNFIACMDGETLVGYISLNPPSLQPFRVTKYFSKEALDNTVFGLCADKDQSTFEVRGLTISPKYRGLNLSLRLMRYALEFVIENGGKDIIAMGHNDVLGLYENNGMNVFRDHGIKPVSYTHLTLPTKRIV